MLFDREKKITVIYATLIIAYVLLAAHAPLNINTIALQDDGLYLRRAMSLVSGDWMGGYDQNILSKGPIYSIFIAIGAITGLPINIFNALFSVLSLLFLVNVLYKLGVNKHLCTFTFFYILFDPYLLPIRIIRESIYWQLAVIIFAIFIHIFVSNEERVSRARLIVYGCFLGMFWLCREESIWIVPSLFVLGLGLFIRKRENIFCMNFFRQTAFLLLGFIALYGLISALNYKSYRTFVTVETTSSYFKRFMSNLNSVEPSKYKPYIPVQKDVREKIYKISPTFSLLKNTLENPQNGWKTHGCNVYPSTCGDYAGGWFIYALRDAVKDAGFYENSARSRFFYESVSKDIEAGCANKIISCRKPVISLMPSSQLIDFDVLAKSFIKSINFVFRLESDHHYSDFPLTNKESLEIAKDFLNGPKTFSTVNFEASGWYRDMGKSHLKLVCKDSDNNETEVFVESLPSDDLVAFFGDPSLGNNRFHVYSQYRNCKFFSNGIYLGSNSLPEKFHIDYVYQVKESNFLKLNRSMKYLYKYLNISLCVLGLVLLSLRFYQNKLVFNNIFIVILFGMTLLLTRMLLVSLIDSTSFPAVSVMYLLPIYPIFSIMQILVLSMIWRPYAKRA